MQPKLIYKIGTHRNCLLFRIWLKITDWTLSFKLHYDSLLLCPILFDWNVFVKLIWIWCCRCCCCLLRSKCNSNLWHELNWKVFAFAISRYDSIKVFDFSHNRIRRCLLFSCCSSLCPFCYCYCWLSHACACIMRKWLKGKQQTHKNIDSYMHEYILCLHWFAHKKHTQKI